MLQELFNAVDHFFEKKHQLITKDMDENTRQKTIYIHDLNVPFLERFKEFEKEIIPYPKHYKIYTMQGFIDYIGKNCASYKDTMLIFIGINNITAYYDPRTNDADLVEMGMVFSPEYQSFLRCCDKAQFQKGLWRELNSAMNNCIDSSLMLALSSVRFDKKNQTEIDIQNSGLTSANVNQTVKITWKNKNGTLGEVPFGVDYEFYGRIWECSDEIATIPFRLEVDHEDDVPTFRFMPIRMDIAVNDCKNLLVKQLQEQLPEFKIFEGKFGLQSKYK